MLCGCRRTAWSRLWKNFHSFYEDQALNRHYTPAITRSDLLLKFDKQITYQCLMRVWRQMAQLLYLRPLVKGIQLSMIREECHESFKESHLVAS